MDQGFFCRIRGVDGVPQNCEVAARSPPLAAGRTDARNGPAFVGHIDREGMMVQLERIEDRLRRGLVGRAWHSPAVLELLAGSRQPWPTHRRSRGLTAFRVGP